MIDQQTRQRILDSAQILDVVSDFISLRRQGVSYVGLCPFHSDRNPSFYVNPAKNICKCFSCGEGGTPLNFIMKHEQLSYSDALKYLAKKYNIEVVEREESEEEKQRNSERESLFIINDYAAKYFQTQLTETEEGRTVGLAYFRERGIRPETIERFGLGYAPESKTAFTEQAIKSGYPLKRLAEVGLSIEYEDHPGKAIDRFRGRVIFPVRNLSGRYVAFGGRVMSKTAKTAKYVNSPESLIYSKSRELYGLYWAKSAISKLGKCYLVEGYTDVLSMYQAGIENVVSSSGTALTIDQIRLIRRFTTTITVLYDGDAAGIKAALRGIDLLLEEGFRIKVVLLPDGEDPDSFARSHSNTELQAYLDEHETDFIHFKIDLYHEEMERDPLRRAELISDIMRSIALIPDTIQRAVLIQSSSTALRMSEELLQSEVNKLRRQGVTAQGFTSPQRTAPVAPPTSAPIPPPFTEPTPSEPAPSSDEYLSPLVVEESIKPFERELMQLLLLYSDREIIIPQGLGTPEFEDEIYPEQDSTFVLSYFIERELIMVGADQEYSPLFARFMAELRSECLEKQISPATYFANHPEAPLREITTALLAESDLLEYRPDQDLQIGGAGSSFSSRILSEEEEREEEARKEARYLGSLALRACNSYKMALLVRFIDGLHQEIKQAQRAGDSTKILECMTEITRLNVQKRRLSDLLGERTIIG